MADSEESIEKTTNLISDDSDEENDSDESLNESDSDESLSKLNLATISYDK